MGGLRAYGPFVPERKCQQQQQQQSLLTLVFGLVLLTFSHLPGCPSFRVWQNTKQLGTQKYSHWSYVIKGEELPGSNVW